MALVAARASLHNDDEIITSLRAKPKRGLFHEPWLAGGPSEAG